MNESKGHLGYVSTWFHVWRAALFFHGLISSVLCVTEVWPRKTQEENEDALLRWDMYGVCYFGFRPSKDLSDWRWNKYKWHWRRALRLSRWTSNRMQLLPWWQAVGQQGGPRTKGHIALLDGLWNRRGLVEQFLNCRLTRKVIPTLRQLKYSVGRTVLILHVTFIIIINIIFHLSIITV